MIRKLLLTHEKVKLLPKVGTQGKKAGEAGSCPNSPFYFVVPGLQLNAFLLVPVPLPAACS